MSRIYFIFTALLINTVGTAQPSMPITTQSEEARQSFIQAREVLSSVWITGGIEEMHLALEYDSTLALAHVYIGISNFFLGKDASAHFASAARHAENATEGEQWMVAGWMYFFSRERDSAAYAFEQVVKLHPKEDYASHILGDVYRAQDRYEDALAIMKPLVNRADPYTYAINHIAYTYKDMGQMDSAFVYMQRFIDSDPANANAYHSMAELYYDNEDLNNAMLNYNKALLADPFFAAAARDLGDVLAENGERILAKEAYELAQERGEKLYGPKFKKGLADRLEKMALEEM